MSMTEERTVESYKNEIKEILTKVCDSFKNEQMYNYDLAEMYNEVKKELESIEGTNASIEEITNLYNMALKLLEENDENEKADSE